MTDSVPIDRVTRFLKLLNRVLWRATKDVDLAKAAVEAISLVRVVHLELIRTDGSSEIWTARNVDEGATPWRDFQTWFHGRPQSLTFRIAYSEGEAGFRRMDIKSYYIRRGMEPIK